MLALSVIVVEVVSAEQEVVVVVVLEDDESDAETGSKVNNTAEIQKIAERTTTVGIGVANKWFLLGRTLGILQAHSHYVYRSFLFSLSLIAKSNKLLIDLMLI